MSAVSVALVAVFALAPVPPVLPVLSGGGVDAAPTPWAELAERHFDLRRRLPDERRAPGRDLLQEMEALVALRFEVEQDGETYRSFGDLARAVGGLAPAERAAWLERLAARAPELFDVWGWPLRELLLDDELFDAEWDPDDSGPRDGFFEIDAWDLAEEGTWPWNDLRVRPIAEQAATLVRSDLATLKELENDYRRYWNDVGAVYEKLEPVSGSFVAGTDEEGRPYSSLRLAVRCDLPFPYDDYAVEISILNRVDEAGRLVTDVYSTSRDVHWLAGRDVFLPIRTSDDAFVGHLMVRQYGFDLRGVPDARRHRRAALRSSLGNLRRAVEPTWRRRGERQPDEDAPVVPSFRVYWK